MESKAVRRRERDQVECGKFEALDDKHVRTEAFEDIGWNVR